MCNNKLNIAINSPWFALYSYCKSVVHAYDNNSSTF